jgi:hypothetical protein
MQIGNGFPGVKEKGAAQLPEPLPTLTMKPTRKTNRARTLLQRRLRPNEEIPSGMNAVVGSMLNPPGYDCFRSDLFSGHRLKCIGHALPGRYCCHRFGKSSRISKSTQKTSPARKQTPRAIGGIVLPAPRPRFRKDDADAPRLSRRTLPTLGQ